MKINLYKLFLVVALFWPMLVSYTNNFTFSQVLYSIIISVISLRILIRKRFIDNSSIFIFSIFFSLAIFFSLIGILSGGSIQRSFSDGFRLIFFALYYVVGRIYSKNQLVDAVFLVKVLKVFTFLSVLISFFVFFPVLHPFVDLFKGRLSNDVLQFHFLRFSGFQGFPSDFGSFLVLIIILLVLDKHNKYFSSKSKLFYFSICIIGLIGSAARTGFLHLITFILLISIVKVLIIISTNKTSKNVFKAFFTFFILISLVIFFFDSLITSKFDIIKYVVFNPEKIDSSATHRFHEIAGSLEVLNKDLFLFGVDRDFPLGLPVIEGFWTHWLLRFSWIGLFFVLFLASFIILTLNNSRFVLNKALLFWFFSFFISVGFFSDVLFRFKGPFIYGFLLGYLSIVHLEKQKSC